MDALNSPDPTQQILPDSAHLQNEATTAAIEIVRPDRNLEKWPIWQPSSSRHAPKVRTIQREVRLPDGSKAIATVEVGFTNKGVLTTEDQKTCYALIKHWEDRGRPENGVFFSRQQLARILKKSWGRNVNQSLTASLMRLRFTPFTWERSYYDNTTRETVERIKTFNILADLELTSRSVDGHTTKETSYFRFNERILKNLLSHYTKPVFLDTILSFQSEIAQILYTHLDLVLSDKSHYERRTKELFEDLGIEGTAYRYPSKRAQMLEHALHELEGSPLPTGTLKQVTLERTVDDHDYKIVVRKGRSKGTSARAKARTGGEEEEKPSQPLTLPPVVAGSNGGGIAAVPAMPANSTREPSPDTATPAFEQVRHFYQIFFKSGETARPTSKELTQAQNHIARLGGEKARYLVTFAYREAKRTDFAIQTYGGIAQYEGRAIGEYEENTRQRREAILEKARRGHQERFSGAYLQYLRESYREREEASGAPFTAFLESEEKERKKFTTGPLAKHPAMRRVARDFEEEEARLKRFAELFRSAPPAELLLDFWEWDAALNPERFSPETHIQADTNIGRPIKT